MALRTGPLGAIADQAARITSQSLGSGHARAVHRLLRCGALECAFRAAGLIGRPGIAHHRPLPIEFRVMTDEVLVVEGQPAAGGHVARNARPCEDRIVQGEKPGAAAKRSAAG
jgi:hypothetical protein